MHKFTKISFSKFKLFITILASIITINYLVCYGISKAKSVSKDFMFNKITTADIKDCSCNVLDKNKLVNYRLDELEKIVLVRILTTSGYVENFEDTSVNKRSLVPYISATLNSGTALKIYGTSSGDFVIEYNKTLYFGMDSRFSIFFDHVGVEAMNAKSRDLITREKYRPEIFKFKDFVNKAHITKWDNSGYNDNILSGKYRIATLSTSKIRLYEYGDNVDMECDAWSIGKDGYSFSNIACVDWVEPPHVFKRGNLIAIYIGNDKKTIDTLVSIMGRQYAGVTE